ncbi:alpha/beta fold hydrolase [Gemmatimonadota bacterium]
MVRGLVSLLMLVGVSGCQEAAPTVSEVNPGEYLVTTAGGVSLEVIEWGGSGRPLLFLGGGAATAHFFDDFAPLLVGDFRVLGLTRRGLGGSSDIPPNDFEDLLDDLFVVVEALELGSVVLVGHSFAGFEMTRFAERYGDRCAGLVYLDAAYDYAMSDIARIYQETPPPEAPPMTADDSSSVRSVQAWYERTQGFRPAESEVLETGRFDSGGRYLGRVPMTATARGVASIGKPQVDLEALACPSLGLFPIPGPLELWYPYYESWGAEERSRADAWQEAYLAWVEETRDNFDRYPETKVIEFLNAGHMFFLESPGEAVDAIRGFVLGLE